MIRIGTIDTADNFEIHDTDYDDIGHAQAAMRFVQAEWDGDNPIAEMLILVGDDYRNLEAVGSWLAPQYTRDESGRPVVSDADLMAMDEINLLYLIKQARGR